MEEKISIGFSGKLIYDKPVNDQFTLCKCYVMALGKNQNRTIITEEASQKALPTLFNIPVVGHLYENESKALEMGGHDMELQRDEDGHVILKTLTVPFGVVPNQDDVHYEEITESNGDKKTYLVADVILWTGRYPELLEASLGEGVRFSQSIEIKPLKTERDGEYLNIEEYQYSALCLLGQNVQPCFEQARIESYNFSAEYATEEWSKLFAEFKEELTKCYSKVSTEEGGEMAFDTENEDVMTAESDAVEEATIVIEIDDGAIAEEATGEVFTQSVDMQITEVPEVLKYEVEMTYEEKRCALERALVGLCKWTEHEYESYLLIDFDNLYAYCRYRHCMADGTDEMVSLRIPYQINDGDITVEPLNAEEVRQVWLTKEDEKKLCDEQAMLEELRAYKVEREEDDRKKEYVAVLAEFSDLGEIDEYKAVVKNLMDFASADFLREKLFAIRGKYAKPASKKSVAQVRIPVGLDKKSNNADIDDFMSRYLPAKK